MKKASYCVAYLAKKYNANKIWIWDMLEDEYNIMKGYGWLLTDEEYKELEKMVIEGLA